MGLVDTCNTGLNILHCFTGLCRCSAVQTLQEEINPDMSDCDTSRWL
jgi:predicted protein tyrosine phosphatase